MKSVLISIQPKWCELIASGKKTTEVRKTRPKIETPFKCYIYCTNNKDMLWVLQKNERTYTDKLTSIFDAKDVGGATKANGKVIGEFVCDRVQEYESEFVDDDCFETIASIDRDEDGDATGWYEWTNDSDIPYISTYFYQKCCVPYEELKKYIGLGFTTFYGWHISDLVIYDKPKELSEFRTICEGLKPYQCDECEYSYSENTESGSYSECCCNNLKPLKRPPQSWRYVEGVE